MSRKQKERLLTALGLLVLVLLTYCVLIPEADPVDPHAGHRMGSDEPITDGQIQLSPRAQALAQVQLAPVERREVEAEVRLFGKLAYDETRLAHITAWVPGRIERLYLNFTGVQVQEGDHTVEIYSPDLLTAQEELIASSLSLKKLGDESVKYVREQTLKNLESARIKLRLWGIDDEQIAQIEESGKVQTTLTIRAPVSGVVIHKDLVEGQYVETGTRIYSIADLSELWLELDAYESDLTWLRYAQEVEFRTDTYPGKIFQGKISYIDPFLDEKTRTTRVRVNVPNSDGKLKPGMYVRATIRPVISVGGVAKSPDLEGKWVSPMHPNIMSDEPGVCPLCGMDMVEAESLGYVDSHTADGKAPLVIPDTAPLLTGKRAIVYVQPPDKPGIYEAREVVLGPLAKDVYIVKTGLEEGELVVVHGNFKIDSAAQIQAKPSMMAPEGGQKPAMGHHHGH